MSALPELLNLAITHHRAGRLAEAEVLYRRVLVIDPKHADSLHLLGLLAGEAGNFQVAASCIGKAIQYKPHEPIFYRNLGLALHRDQKYQQAIICYSKAIELEPQHVETIVRMGRSLAASGLRDDAINIFLHATGLAPQYAEGHFNLGVALSTAGRFEESAAAYRQVLRLQPSHPSAAYELGNVLQLSHRLDEAIYAYKAYLHDHPEDCDALYQLANTLHLQDRLPEAEKEYRSVLTINPDHSAAWFNLGVTLTRESRTAEAAVAYTNTLRLNPNYAAAHNNLASLRQAEGKLVEAIAGYKEALRLDPNNMDARYNMGLACQEQNHFEEALDAYNTVVFHHPEHEEAQNNRANTLLALGRPAEALAGYEQALLHCPDHVEANFNRGVAQLLLGDFEQGWQGYEWRLRQKDAKKRTLKQPRWDGSNVGSETVLVHAEQGLGDTVQFVRYLPLVKQRCAQVLLECQPRLFPLLSGLPGVDCIVSRGSSLPAFDYQIPLMSLPQIFGTTLATVPAETPYLSANPDLVRHWRGQIGSSNRRRIGIVWGGNAAFKNEWRRGIPLQKLALLANLPGVDLFSLQRGPQVNQLDSMPPEVRIVNLEQEQNQITDTAAIIEVLDLVITVDTMIAHLAGALSRPVWTLLSYAADWRWLLARSDSPWYPEMRLFRQPKEGDWDSVLADVMAALQS